MSIEKTPLEAWRLWTLPLTCGGALPGGVEAPMALAFLAFSALSARKKKSRGEDSSRGGTRSAGVASVASVASVLVGELVFSLPLLLSDSCSNRD